MYFYWKIFKAKFQIIEFELIFYLFNRFKIYNFDSGTPILGLESWNFIPKFQKKNILSGKKNIFSDI